MEREKAPQAAAKFGDLLLTIRRTDPERWERIKARGREIDAALKEAAKQG